MRTSIHHAGSGGDSSDLGGRLPKKISEIMPLSGHIPGDTLSHNGFGGANPGGKFTNSLSTYDYRVQGILLSHRGSIQSSSNWRAKVDSMLNFTNQESSSLCPTNVNIALGNIASCLRRWYGADKNYLRDMVLPVAKALMERCFDPPTLKGFNPREIGEVWSSLAGVVIELGDIDPILHEKNKGNLGRLASRTKALLPSFDLQSLGSIAWGIVDLGMGEIKLADELLTTARLQIDDLAGSELHRLLRLAASQMKPDLEFIDVACKRLEELIAHRAIDSTDRKYNIREVASCVLAMKGVAGRSERWEIDVTDGYSAQLQDVLENSVRILSAFISLQLAEDPILDPSTLGQLCRAISICQHKDAQDLLKNCALRVAGLMEDFVAVSSSSQCADTDSGELFSQMHCLLKVLRAYGPAAHVPHQLFVAASNVVEQFQKIIPVNLAVQIVSLLPERDRAAAGLFAKLCDLILLPRISELDAANAGVLLAACSKLRHGSQALVDSLLAGPLQNWQDLPNDELCIFLYSSSEINFIELLPAKELGEVVSKRISSLTWDQVAAVLRALAIRGEQANHLVWEEVERKPTPSTCFSTAVTSQLQMAALESNHTFGEKLRSAFLEIDDTAIDRQDQMSKHELELLAILKSLGFNPQPQAKCAQYVIDALIEVEINQGLEAGPSAVVRDHRQKSANVIKLAVEFNGIEYHYQNALLPSYGERELGGDSLRRRILEKIGIQTVVIRSDEWNAHKGDVKAQSELIQRKIKEALIEHPRSRVNPGAAA